MRRLGPVLLLGLAACTVGPDYHPPTPTEPAAWANAGGPQVDPAADPDPHWWQSFGDPELTSLVDRAMAGNPGVQRTVFRILQARAQARIAGADGWPSLQGRGSYTREQLGLAGALQGMPPAAGAVLGPLVPPFDLYSFGFDASWELDLFGRVRRSVEQARAREQAAEEGRNDALVSLQAEVFQNYAQLRSARELTRTTSEDIANEERILALTRQRRAKGLVSELDVDQAATQLRNVQAQLPPFERQADQAVNSLAVLLGQPPDALRAELSAPGGLPLLPPKVPVGLPAALARRRPDIRAAEANLHAATAGVGVAVAQLFPDLSLSGTLGLRTTQFPTVTDWANHFYTAGGALTLPIFQGGRLVGNIELARAEQGEAVLAYRETVLNALRDVENALVALRTDQQREERLRQVVGSAQDVLYLAQNRYEHGLASFIDVLSSESTLVQARQQWIQAQTASATDLAALYKALGGGWESA